MSEAIRCGTSAGRQILRAPLDCDTTRAYTHSKIMPTQNSLSAASPSTLKGGFEGNRNNSCVSSLAVSAMAARTVFERSSSGMTSAVSSACVRTTSSCAGNVATSDAAKNSASPRQLATSCAKCAVTQKEGLAIAIGVLLFLFVFAGIVYILLKRASRSTLVERRFVVAFQKAEAKFGIGGSLRGFSETFGCTVRPAAAR